MTSLTVIFQPITRILTFKFVVAIGNRQSAIGSNTIIWFYVFISLSLRQSAVDTRKSEATFELGLTDTGCLSVPAARRPRKEKDVRDARRCAVCHRRSEARRIGASR